ncbi:hypothetical protein [Paenibacillus hexagrammi]|uniref:Uncharacterized protein n=1 Tax=Paenibacillus hexagrammi TaxID=2908839 RepID=A0ABY3SP20_9BACL|nr:hypothetical protein [Paenibacillus sp. YPD9-1]UJF35175.1 hypothetical protein L0M14_08630 [Paenibacillus sp. YPD9-1]
MNSRFRYTRLAAMALSATLVLGPMNNAWADSQSAPVVSSVGTVSISDSSYFELKQIHVLPEASGKLATFTITIHNDSSNELQFIDYWVRLKSKTGNQFSARLLPADKDKNRVSPKSSEDLTFYATVNSDTNLQDLIVQFIKWDFSQSNFERVLGEVEVPDGYTDITPADGSSIISVGGNDVTASIKKFVSNKNEKYYVPTVYLTLENSGSHSVTIPSYLFSIRTPEGLLYPLEAKGTKNLTINPKESKEIQLSGSIPVAVAPDGWQLTLAEAIADLKMNIAIAAFQLPAVASQEEGSLGKEYSFTDKSGVYYAALNGLHRLPWEDQDIVTADLTLSNKGDDSLPIPALTGYFLLDDAVKVEANLVQTAKVIGLAAGSSVNLQIAAKIPYTYEFSQIKLVLQEKDADGDSTSSGTDTGSADLTDVLEFSSQAELQAIPYIGMGESYATTSAGHRTNYKIRSIQTYGGNTGSLFTAQLEATNAEKRYTNVSKIVAHFRAPDGTIFPADVAEITNKVSPSGKALINVSAKIPKGFSTENMNLMIGDAITEGELTVGDKKPDSYVNPVSFWLPDELKDAKSTLKGLTLYPYTITLDHISTQIDNSTFTLGFNYEIQKDLLIETNMEGHKLVLVFEDGKGRKGFEKSFEAKEIDPVDGDTPDTAGTKLKLGKHENFEISMTDEDLIYKSTFLKKYKLSLYDELDGQRRLLGSQDIDWFVTTD